MSKSPGHHPFRRILLLTAVLAAVLAYRNAVADKGGSYDPAAGR
ncbi:MULTISPECIES: hypothetical protein [Aeromicrobium]|nr:MULTISPECIES: hypothetical protein [Aeromicrobium]